MLTICEDLDINIGIQSDQVSVIANSPNISMLFKISIWQVWILIRVCLALIIQFQ